MKYEYIEICCEPYDVDIRDNDVIHHYGTGGSAGVPHKVKKIKGGYVCEQCALRIPKVQTLLTMTELRYLKDKLEKGVRPGGSGGKVLYYASIEP